MSEPVRILIVEDTPSDFELAQREIRKAVSECVFQHVQTHDDFLRALDVFQPDLILSDYHMPRFDGLTALQIAQEHAKLTPFIIWTGTMGEDVAVELMRAGAVNYILKENIKRLGPAVAHALEERRLLLEHKQAEETIRHNEKRFRALIENGRDNISLLAVDGTLLWESPATVRSLGYAHDEFVGHNIFELIHPDDLQWISELYANLLQEPGSRRDGDFRLRHRDGSWRWNEATVTNMLDEPAVNAIVAKYRDIIERKQAERALREHEQQLSSVYNTAADVLFLLIVEKDKRYRFVSVNQSFLTTTGLNEDQVIDKYVDEIIPEPALTMVLGKYRQAIQEKRIMRWEETSDYPKGRLTGDVSIAPVFDETGKCTHLVGAVHDITERKRAEEQIELQLQRLKALRAIDTAISSSFDLHLTLDILLDQVLAQLNTDAAAILLFQPVTRTLEHAASRGFRSTAIRETRVRLGEGYAGKAILERRIIHSPDLMETKSELAQALLLKGEDFIDYYCVPLIVK